MIVRPKNLFHSSIVRSRCCRVNSTWLRHKRKASTGLAHFVIFRCWRHSWKNGYCSYCLINARLVHWPATVSRFPKSWTLKVRLWKDYNLLDSLSCLLKQVSIFSLQQCFLAQEQVKDNWLTIFFKLHPAQITAKSLMNSSKFLFSLFTAFFSHFPIFLYILLLHWHAAKIEQFFENLASGTIYHVFPLGAWFIFLSNPPLHTGCSKKWHKEYNQY